MLTPHKHVDIFRRAPTQKGEARRVRLLNAAADAFLKHGYPDTSIQMVVREAGGSVATAYQLFGNKEGLLVAVLQREFEHMQHHVFPEALFQLPVARALEEITERLLGYAARPRSVNFYRLLMSECGRLELIADYFRQQTAIQVHHPIEQCLRRACERGELVIDDPASAALMLGHLVHGITHEARLVGGYCDGPSEQDRAICRYSIQAFLKAFQS